MSKVYDKKVCLKNLGILIDQKKIKIGQLEQAVGVSAGYLSRLSKDDNTTKISIELLAALSEQLDVSMDTLACTDLEAMTPTEQYIYLFIEKLMQETQFSNRSWEKETQGALATVKPCGGGTTSHPLFRYEDGDVYFNSFFNPDSPYCSVGGDMFHTRISDDTLIYLANVKYNSYSSNDYELYIVEENQYNNDTSANPVCATNPKSNSAFDSKLRLLYNVVADSCKHVSVSPYVRGVIDRFMSPPADFDDGELPF